MFDGRRAFKTRLLVDHSIPVQQHTHVMRWGYNQYGVPRLHNYSIRELGNDHPWIREAEEMRQEAMVSQPGFFKMAALQINSRMSHGGPILLSASGWRRLLQLPMMAFYRELQLTLVQIQQAEGWWTVPIWRKRLQLIFTIDLRGDML